MDLGTTIKKVRQQKGMRQNSLAEMSGITATYLSQIESNQKEPNLATLREISKQLGIPLPILFFLSLDAGDIEPSKQTAYNYLAPSIQAMISEFFLKTPNQ